MALDYINTAIGHTLLFLNTIGIKGDNIVQNIETFITILSTASVV
jgi:hypothetical protein